MVQPQLSDELILSPMANVSSAEPYRQDDSYVRRFESLSDALTKLRVVDFALGELSDSLQKKSHSIGRGLQLGVYPDRYQPYLYVVGQKNEQQPRLTLVQNQGRHELFAPGQHSSEIFSPQNILDGGKETELHSKVFSLYAKQLYKFVKREQFNRKYDYFTVF